MSPPTVKNDLLAQNLLGKLDYSRFRTFQYVSKRFKTVQNGSKRFNDVQSLSQDEKRRDAVELDFTVSWRSSRGEDGLPVD